MATNIDYMATFLQRGAHRIVVSTADITRSAAPLYMTAKAVYKGNPKEFGRDMPKEDDFYSTVEIWRTSIENPEESHLQYVRKLQDDGYSFVTFKFSTRQ